MFDNLPDNERIALAKAKIEEVLWHAIELAALRANNDIVVFSPMLAEQITRSYAANAFNVFQHSMYSYEIVRLCALWDRAGRDRNSIPTVVALIERPTIVEALVAETRAHWQMIRSSNITSAHPEANEAELEAVTMIQDQLCSDQTARARSELIETVESAKRILNDSRLTELRHHRSKHLAHHLSFTEKAESRALVKYGYTAELFNLTTPIVEKLNTWVVGNSFSITETQKISRKCAEALWGGCKFSVEC
jgi:hypothetical protein